MKTRCIVVASNSSIRGPRLAHKAGLFCLRSEGLFAPKYRRPAFTEPLIEEVTPAKVDCWTAVIGGPLFCSPTNVQQFHAHRNFHTTRPAKSRIYSPRDSAAKGRHFIGKTPADSRVQFQLTG